MKKKVLTVSLALVMGVLIGGVSSTVYHQNEQVKLIDAHDKERVAIAGNSFTAGCMLAYVIGTGVPLIPPRFAEACKETAIGFIEELNNIREL